MNTEQALTLGAFGGLMLGAAMLMTSVVLLGRAIDGRPAAAFGVLAIGGLSIMTSLGCIGAMSYLGMITN